MTREECVEASGCDDLLFADGFDEAILGIGQRFNDVFVVYDRDVVLDTLVKRDGMSYEQAVEFFDFNIVGAYVGEQTPCYVSRSCFF